MNARFSSPFVMKVRFTTPSPQSQSRNAAHIQYIGTRPGVETTRNFEELVTTLSNDDHVKYLHERPGSHGLFDQQTNRRPMINEIQGELQSHQGLVWRFVLSLKEEDALRLGYEDRRKWEETLRATVPLIANKMGISESNCRWVAAFHKEKGHPHVHLVLWEKNPQRVKGRLSKGERIAVKKDLMREIYSDERIRLTQEKTAMRDLLRDYAKRDTGLALRIGRELKEVQHDVAIQLAATGAMKVELAPTPYKDELKFMYGKLQDLSLTMPDRGRVTFAFMPEEVKAKTLDIVREYLEMPAYRLTVKSYLDSVESLTRLHTVNDESIARAKQNAMNDLEKRLGNILIKSAAFIQQVDTVQKTKHLEQSIAGNVFQEIFRVVQYEKKKTDAQTEWERKQLTKTNQVQRRKEHER